MLKVKTPEETLFIIQSNFGNLSLGAESVPLRRSLGRVLSEDITSEEFVPGFDRSSVDGYAIISGDTFGCSDSLPSLLQRTGEVKMGFAADTGVKNGECLYVQTGGEIPGGADSVVMVEYTEEYGDGTVGIFRPCAPGENITFKGDDVIPGKRVLIKGHTIKPHDIGTLSALGRSIVNVYKKPAVCIISTGNELIPCDEQPANGQMRDVNSNMLEAAVTSAGGEARMLGIVRDDEKALISLLDSAGDCDMILISGGSSAGSRDITFDVINRLGTSLIHGIAMKPGKPTIIGEIKGKPVFGLPGHPVAAFFTFEVFVYPLICQWQGTTPERPTLEAVMKTQIPSNHGRAEYVAVQLDETEKGIFAIPVRGKSGLITLLSDSRGYIIVPRDCEGFQEGSPVTVNLYR